MPADRLTGYLIKHELTHSIENTAQWDQLVQIVRSGMGEQAFIHAMKETAQRYAANNETLTDRGAEREVVAQWVGQNLFQNGFAQAIVSGNASVGNAFVRTLDKLRLALGGTKNSRTASNIALVERLFMRALENSQVQNDTATEGGSYSISEIVDINGKSYGIGVHLDSTLLDNLTPEERIQMVKEYVKELGGSVFTAYDENDKAVEVTIAEKNARFKNKTGKKVPVNKDLTTKYIKNEVKQEAIALVDELITAAEYNRSSTSNYSHDWLDNQGENDWEYWSTYIQDKNNTIWKATLNIANSADGRKILYDIDPIKKVGQSVESDTIPTNTIKAQNSFGVNNYSMQFGEENSQYSFGDADEGGAITPPPSDAANSQALGNLGESADRAHISMEEFANTDAPIWRNVAYEDDETKARIMQETHQRMVESGSVVVVSDSVLEDMEQAFSDLREMKKRDRTPILKAAIDKVKEDIRQFLNGFKKQGFEFEVNGKVLDAKLYSTGINEVLEKITKQKAGMLYSSEEIFRNARYLYSTPDYDGDPNIYRWNYFYTPLQIGDETVGVRIAVRDMAKQGESQIYNWGIKKDTSLGGVGDDFGNRKSHGASSDVSSPILPDSQPNVKENSSSKPIAQGRTLEELASELGDEELSRRMYMAMQAQPLPSTVEVDGQSVDTSSYIDAVERDLPNDPEGLREFIRDAEQQLAAAAGQAYINGEPESITGLPINLQLFAARRRLDMMLDEGETGKNGRMGSNTGIFLIPFTKNNLCDILSFVSDTRGEFRIMYKILKKRVLNPTVVWMDIEAPAVAKKANPGQFIMLRVDENGERIPLTIADYDREAGSVTIIFQLVGATTQRLGQLNEGDFIQDFVGPLGKKTETEGKKKVAVVAGGVGSAIALPVAKKFHEQGTEVHTIVGFRNKDLVILKEEFEAVSDRMFLMSDDGSCGEKGLVTDALRRLIEAGEQYDEVITIGPLIMMKFVCALTKSFGIKTVASMNPIMIDGTGMCGGCRLTVGGETKFACVDGPEFDGHLIDFDEAIARSAMYRPFERQKHEDACRLYKKEG